VGTVVEVTSDSGDAAEGSSAEQGGERRRITRSFYAVEGARPQAGYEQQGQQYGGAQGYSHQTGPSLGTGLGEQSSPSAGPGFGGPKPPSGGVGKRGGRGRKGGLLAVAGTAALVIVVAVGYLVLKPSSTGFVPTAGNPSGDAQQITNAFLQAWGSGNISKAASYTDDPSAATASLTRYQKDLNLQKLSGTAGTATGVAAPAAPKGGAKPTSGPAASSTLEHVSFKVNADVASPPGSARQLSGNWAYSSALTAYQAPGSDGWYIEWRPDVVAPNLTASQHLASVPVAPQVLSVTDAGGGQLQGYNDPGLTTISGLLAKKGPAGQGKAGLGVQIENAKNQEVPNSLATVVSAQDIGQLATTIDPKAEKAAKAAVAQKKQSAMVVIQPSSGKILAIANNSGQNDFALTAAVAPGSDFKIVTSAALFNNGFTTVNSPVACPKTYNVGGITIKNDKGESEPPSTPFSYDFAQSCNNAFTQWWSKLQSSSAQDKLAYTAKQYFGLNQPWDIGVAGQSAQYYTMKPNEPNSALAEEAFGQGSMQACPLAMASVAATVESGSFKQPVLVPGTKQISGTSSLPGHTKSQLWQAMRAVVTEGTAKAVGFGSDVYGKTGTADVTAGTQPNAWFVAFAPDKDVAVADVVLNSGYGSQSAAPEVKTLIDGY